MDIAELLTGNVIIPKSAFWTAVATVVSGMVANFIYSWNRINRIEKEIELLKVKYEKDVELLKLKYDKDLEIFGRIEKKVDESITKLSDIEKQMVLKKDKKFIE